ncbi:hypothetical protein T01_3561 [Trichinella spiralis]|uniref:Uncharacterized protein n=1 Tax=Trichinella spiralis TaxID=6334 RepID=A0A0V1B440_TRISP|nr:hypothetical protein T01_8850 [Trichinella spiralis]KRY31746.1 hypothetical protein T01_3561 [Trichinella spiralis]
MNYAKIGRPQRRYQILPGHACVRSTFPIHVQYKNKQTSTSDDRPEQLKYHQLIEQTQPSKIYIQEYVCVMSSANRNTFVDIATPIICTLPVALFQVELGFSSNSNSRLNIGDESQLKFNIPTTVLSNTTSLTYPILVVVELQR